MGNKNNKHGKKNVAGNQKTQTSRKEAENRENSDIKNEQEADIQKKNEQDEQDIEKLRKEIGREDAEIRKKQDELAVKEADKQTGIDSFSRKYEDADKLPKIIREELEQAAGKKNKEKNPEESADAEEKIKKLKDIQDITFRLKLKNDISQIESTIDAKTREIDQKEKQKIKPVSGSENKSESSLNLILDKKSTHPGGGQKTTLEVSELPYLPEIGRLYQAGGQDYLAINNWEEFEPGQKEAERLKAILCAKRS
ncbi:MAG: hypothetical protein LBQ88_15710 [Treponema sp.]|jgi:hypothetical protein|nr:hypothetical protein [Treponema sp.]